MRRFARGCPFVSGGARSGSGGMGRDDRSNRSHGPDRSRAALCQRLADVAQLCSSAPWCGAEKPVPGAVQRRPALRQPAATRSPGSLCDSAKGDPGAVHRRTRCFRGRDPCRLTGNSPISKGSGRWSGPLCRPTARGGGSSGRFVSRHKARVLWPIGRRGP